MPPKVDYTLHEGENGTEVRVARAGQANDLAADPVLLSGEGETGKGGGPEVGVRSSRESQALEANKELDILHLERGGVGGTGVAVLSRTEEEKEGQHNHTGRGHIAWIVGSTGRMGNVAYYRDRDGFDPVWGRILFLVVIELAGKAEIQFAAFDKAGIWGPHCSERLANTA